MGRSLEARIEQLEETTPKDYTTFDANGDPVIASGLPARDWLVWAFALMNNPRRKREREALRQQLSASTGVDSGRGRLYELILAAMEGPWNPEV